jgi:predicted nucleic acid-binding protein
VAVVSNFSPLIALAGIRRLDFLPAIFESVLIPPAVAREISPSIPVLPPWLRIHAPSVLPPAPLLRRRLGAGEREALALAIELKADWIILDDLPARRSAEAAGLNVIGTLGTLLAAKRAGLLNSSPGTRCTVAHGVLPQRAALRRTASGCRRNRFVIRHQSGPDMMGHGRAEVLFEGDSA